MPRGAAVIRYEGPRGVSWFVKYVDAGGRHVKERAGREPDVDRKAAEHLLRQRLVEVKNDGRRRVEPTAFSTFASEWVDTYADAKGLKRSTRESYRSIVDRHLSPFFRSMPLDRIGLEAVEKYVAAKRRPTKERKHGYGPRTVNHHLNLLHEILESARKRRLISTNPVELVDRPRMPRRRRWTILTPAEIVRVGRGFAELAAEADDDAGRRWLEQARVVFLTVVGAGLRRGEILGLRWSDLALADPGGPRLRVVRTWVRGAEDTPKSEAGERTIALGPVLADELFQHRARTVYQSDGDLVFCHPEKGSALDHKRYAETLRQALTRAGIARPMRPFHDGRHTSITNAAAAGTPPAALMARAGHADFATTRLYIDLAGETFREEAERLERRVFSGMGTESGYQIDAVSSTPATEGAS